MKLRMILSAWLLTLACNPPADDDGETAGDVDPVVTEELGGGTYKTTLDATDGEAWRYFDFESKSHILPADAAADAIWDLGALRFNVKTNGGTSGTGGAAVAILEGTSFDAVTEAPADGYVEDSAEGPGVGGSEMADVSPGYAFDNWFDYDMDDHTLSAAADRIYVVRTPEGNHYKVEMLGYYDGAGTPGFVSFRWAALP